MIFTNLETERLILKVIDMDDAEFMYKQFSNDDVNRYLFDEEPFTSIDEAKDLIHFYTDEKIRNQNRWIIIKKDTKEKMGTCGFHCWNKETGECELGYDMYPTYWKHGYMTEALKEIIKFAKEVMQVKRLETHIAVENTDSINTSVRQGFVDSKKTYMEVFRGKEYLHYIYTLDL